MKNTHLISKIDYSGPQEECIMTICTGAPSCNSDYWRATIKEVSKKFTKIHIILADTLDRYNFMRDYEIDSASQYAVQRANAWLEVRENDMQELFSNNYSITRWDSVLAHPSYTAVSKIMWDLYQTDDIVRQRFDLFINEHVSNIIDRNAHIKKYEHNKLSFLSKSYLIEEYAGLVVMAKIFPNLPEIYPGACLTKDQDFFNKAYGTNLLTIPEVPDIVFLNSKDKEQYSIAA